MPVMAGPEMTEAAIADCLAQSVPTRVLVILQGVSGSFRDRLEAIAEQEPRLLIWSHDPCLPSLSATWNRALQFVWGCGGEEALVVNNDLRIDACTVLTLKLVMAEEQALFVSAVGVTQEQYDTFQKAPGITVRTMADQKGGPDFSCFLISRRGHWKYPFDEAFIPAFCEDLDMHRRYMLGGDGDQIFSVNLPFWHLGGGSQTIKTMTPEARQQHEARIGISRKHYEAKWGGPVNQERYTIPFDAASAQDGVTTPELQRLIQGGGDVVPHEITTHGPVMLPTRQQELQARVAAGELLSDRENDELQHGL